MNQKQTIEPTWLLVLRTAARPPVEGGRGQKEVAKALGVSPSTLSLVLTNKYQASLTNIEQRVRGVLMSEKRDCPVMGPLSAERCLEMQGKRPKSLANSLRTLVWNRCQTCVHRVTKGGES